MIRISHFRAKCIGCNSCVESSEYRWRISRKDGKCTLIGGVENNGFYTSTVSDDEYETTLKAVKNCPVKIIKIEKLS